MTLGGLLKHLALVENRTTTEKLAGQPVGSRWDSLDFADPEWEWRTAAGNSPEELYGLWRGPRCSGCRAPAATRTPWATSGLVAHVDDEPSVWVAVEPRTAYPKLRTSRVPWSVRDEDKGDDGIWAVTCFVVRKGYRGRGLTCPLARVTIDFARERGAWALEDHPIITQPGKEITWGEVHVGARQVFEDAGFEEVSRPPSDGWSCGSTSNKGATYVDGGDHGDVVARRRVDRPTRQLDYATRLE